MTSKKVQLIAGLMAILFLSLFFNLRNIDFGLPAPYHPDERYLNNVIRANQGVAWNHFYYPPAFGKLVYILTKCFVPDKINLSSYENGFIIFLYGRYLSAFFACMTSLLIFYFGYSCSGLLGGFLSSLLLTVSPLFSVSAHYATTDTALTFFASFSLFLYMKYLSSKRLLFLLSSALSLGIATGFKYPGAIFIIPMILHEFFFLKDRITKKIQRIGIVLLISSTSFFCLNPSILMNLNKTVKDLGYILSWLAPCSEHRVQNTEKLENQNEGFRKLYLRPSDTRFLYHIQRSIIKGLTWPVFILFILATLFWNNKREKYFLIVCFFIYLTFIELLNKSAPTVERYALPIIPIICFICGVFVSEFKFEKRRGITLISGAIIIILFILNQFRTTWPIIGSLKQDTRDLANQWISENVTFKDKVFLFGLNNYFPFPDFKKINFQYVFWPSILSHAPKNSIIIESSFYSERFYYPISKETGYYRQYADGFAGLTLLKEFRASSGPYLFNNPTIRIYRKNKIF